MPSRMTVNSITSRGKVLILFAVIGLLYVLLGSSVSTKQLLRPADSTQVAPSIRVVLDSNILTGVESGGSNEFVLLPASKLREYVQAAGDKNEVVKKVTEISHPAEKSKEISKESSTNPKLSVVAKPNLSQMINATQSVVTVSAPYRFENPTLCTSVHDLSVLIIVHTACKNYERRLSIRKTWANSSFYEKDTRILFLVGISETTDNDTKRNIEYEFNKFGDLLVGDFTDSYQNLTLKGVMAYKWITERCRNAKIILKIDDDITVNMFKFFAEIYSKYSEKRKHIICNYILSGSMPILRDRTSKWFVNGNHFRGFNEYPTDYCSGFFVVMTNDIIPSLYASAKITPFFWVDDVYLYGLLPGNVPGVQYIGLEGNWHMLGGQDALKCYKNATQTCPFLALGAGAKGEPEDLWHEILKRQALLES